MKVAALPTGGGSLLGTAGSGFQVLLEVYFKEDEDEGLASRGGLEGVEVVKGVEGVGGRRGLAAMRGVVEKRSCWAPAGARRAAHDRTMRARDCMHGMV